MKSLALALLLVFAVGCKHGASPASVQIGMTRDQVVAALGPGLVTGTKNDMVHNETWERISYRSGNDGLAVELTNGKLTKSYTVPNEAPAWAKKVTVGMSVDQVLAALGEPGSGRNSRDNNAQQSWMYASPIAPVQTLMVEFKDGKVTRSMVMNNDAYGLG